MFFLPKGTLVIFGIDEFEPGRPAKLASWIESQQSLNIDGKWGPLRRGGILQGG